MTAQAARHPCPPALAALVAGLLALVCLAPSLARAQFETLPRAALVIGNSNYEAERLGHLPNPVNDARAMNAVLRELGFDVTLQQDGDHATTKETVAAITETFPEGGVGLFYYAGHGVQYKGVNYLLPTDFDLTSPERLPEDSLALNDVLRAMDAAGIELGIVILDACRENPFGDISDAFGQGLALVDAPGQTLIAYATSPGGLAEDGVGPNSPYTGALVSALELPGQDIYDVFRLVRAKVRQATNNRQIPWFLASLETEFSFRPQERQTADVLSLPEERITLASVQWRTIQDSVDPTDFERFLTLHAETPYATMAERRLDDLREAGRDPLPEVDIRSAGPAPTVQGGLASRVTECDIMAADPDDPYRITAGVPWGLVNTRVAIRACVRSLAQDENNPRLMFTLGRALDIAERFDEAEEFYRQAASRDYSTAHKLLGYMYRTARGRERDDAEAAQYYLEAALRGNPGARTSLAALYQRGWGVPESHQEALRWFRLAADSGHAGALDALGEIYRKGLGVETNAEEAIRHYRIAAMLGHSNAMHNLGRAYLNGDGIEKDYEQAVEWLARATSEGNPYSPYYLGRMFHEAWGVARSYSLAHSYFKLSADRGFAEAWFKLAEMYEAGEGMAPDPAGAYYHYWIAREAGRFHGLKYSLQMAETAEERLRALRGEHGEAAMAPAGARARAWLEEQGMLQFRLVNTW